MNFSVRAYTWRIIQWKISIHLIFFIKIHHSFTTLSCASMVFKHLNNKFDSILTNKFFCSFTRTNVSSIHIGSAATYSLSIFLFISNFLNYSLVWQLLICRIVTKWTVLAIFVGVERMLTLNPMKCVVCNLFTCLFQKNWLNESSEKFLRADLKFLWDSIQIKNEHASKGLEVYLKKFQRVLSHEILMQSLQIIKKSKRLKK